MLGRVVVIGCGLIGGSIVKGLRTRGGATSLAAIDGPEVLDAAASWLDDKSAPASEKARKLIGEADLVVLAAPIATIVSTLSQVLDQISPVGVVTDCGSVKRLMIDQVARHARRDRFVAGHPMAGRELGGFAASLPSLFEGRRWYFIPDDAAPEAADRVVQLIRLLGSTAVAVRADEHDQSMAYVSHVPHLIASALVDMVAAAGHLGDAGPGFEDTTRIAGGPEDIWRDILSANHANIGQALEDLMARIATMRDELGSAGGGTLEKSLGVLARARRSRGR
jgi:prephenate dehydrogenase